MSGFFEPGAAEDPVYRRLRAAESPVEAAMRDRLEDLWSVTSPYLHPRRRLDARRGLHSVFWEMYVVRVCLQAGLSVRRLHERRCRRKGPDIQVGDVDAWIEACIAKHGKVRGDSDKKKQDAVRSSCAS